MASNVRGVGGWFVRLVAAKTHLKRRPMGLLVIAGVILSWPAVAVAATFVVNSTLDAVDALPGNGVCATAGAVCTLRAAVQEANALTGTHVITLPAGTYTLTIAGREELNAATGDLNIKANITINGVGAATTIIDANTIDRAFQSRFSSLTLNDMTVRNGRADGTSGVSGFGGCFYIAYTQLTLSRVIVTACTANSTGSNVGGGIAIFGSTSLGLSTLTMADTTITLNSSSGSGVTAYGGGVYINSGTTATISRSTISANSADSASGLLLFGSSSAGSSDLTLTDTTIAQNVSTEGAAGVYVLASGTATATIANTTITGNIATSGNGGAIVSTSGTMVTLANVTIATNSSATGGAVVSLAPFQVRNTIIANNTGAAPSNCSAGSSITDLGNNLEFPGTTCGFSLPSDRRANPLLGALAFNGGPTKTLALMPGSPAIDAGDDATCAAAPVSGKDQRGVSRFVGAGMHCDMGAFEGARIIPLDFDGDSRTDRTVFRPSAGVWYAALSSGSATATAWGVSTDLDVPADYDGDRKGDLAVWRPSTGQWFIIQSATGTVRVDDWGVNGDIPLAGDVDGDGKADLVIWRPSTGTWYAKKSTGGTLVGNWGMSGDQPLLGDFDGDGKADFTIYRAGVWYALLSGGGSTAIAWGVAGDIPVQGDWDGDGRADAGIFRPGTGQWFISKSSGGAITVNWGVAGDIPLSGDHDGDGKSDYLIWRPSTGVWYTQFAAGGTAAVLWGTAGDRPVGRVPGS